MAPSTSIQDANRAFDLLLLGFTQLGVSLLDDKTINLAFGGLINQTALDAHELQDSYISMLSDKYSEPPESVIMRLRPIDRPTGIVQLQNEILEQQTKKMMEIKFGLETAINKANQAEKRVVKLEHVQRQIEEKRRKLKRKSQQTKSKKKK